MAESSRIVTPETVKQSIVRLLLGSRKALPLGAGDSGRSVTTWCFGRDPAAAIEDDAPVNLRDSATKPSSAAASSPTESLACPLADVKLYDGFSDHRWLRKCGRQLRVAPTSAARLDDGEGVSEYVSADVSSRIIMTSRSRPPESAQPCSLPDGIAQDRLRLVLIAHAAWPFAEEQPPTEFLLRSLVDLVPAANEEYVEFCRRVVRFLCEEESCSVTGQGVASRSLQVPFAAHFPRDERLLHDIRRQVLHAIAASHTGAARHAPVVAAVRGGAPTSRPPPKSPPDWWSSPPLTMEWSPSGVTLTKLWLAVPIEAWELRVLSAPLTPLVAGAEPTAMGPGRRRSVKGIVPPAGGMGPASHQAGGGGAGSRWHPSQATLLGRLLRHYVQCSEYVFFNRSDVKVLCESLPAGGATTSNWQLDHLSKAMEWRGPPSASAASTSTSRAGSSGKSGSPGTAREAAILTSFPVGFKLVHFASSRLTELKAWLWTPWAPGFPQMRQATAPESAATSSATPTSGDAAFAVVGGSSSARSHTSSASFRARGVQSSVPEPVGIDGCPLATTEALTTGSDRVTTLRHRALPAQWCWLLSSAQKVDLEE